MQLTQPFGTNGYGVDYYTKYGMKGHNGWDLRAPTGTEVFASCDGSLEVLRGGSGYGNEARIFNSYGYEVVYAHLLDFIGDSRQVKQGELIAHSNNTGDSTGPHVHFGVRRFATELDGSRRTLDYGNGYKGYLDPMQFFDTDPFALPVDSKYGEKERHMTELQWYAANRYFYQVTKRLMNTREKHALCWGYWDLRAVLDVSMFDVWTQMTKPEAIKRGIIKA